MTRSICPVLALLVFRATLKTKAFTLKKLPFPLLFMRLVSSKASINTKWLLPSTEPLNQFLFQKVIW